MIYVLILALYKLFVCVDLTFILTFPSLRFSFLVFSFLRIYFFTGLLPVFQY